MTNEEGYDLLTAVTADLEWVTDRLRENPDGPNAVTLLGGVTRWKDEFGGRVARINMAVAQALASEIGNVTCL